LAGDDLRDHRHVCALLEGQEEADELLLPFIIDGVEQGDRAFHIVDPRLFNEHVARLTSRGIDVPALTASHRLEIRTWTDSYLRTERFDRSAQVAYIRQNLRAGRELGFPRTRLVASLDWVPRDPTVMNDVVVYETRIEELLRRLPDIVICTYDLNLHSARTIADVLGVHAAAIVGGVLRTNRIPARASARDRLVTAASHLFHEAGIQATGVDAIIDAAGVAKATFYRHFPSKDDLVVAWLRDSRTRWFDRVRAQAQESRAEPHEEVLVVFEAVAEWLEAERFRGCAYLNTALEITDPDQPARQIVREYLGEIEAYFRNLLAPDYVDAELLGRELHALLAGAISLGVARQTIAFVLAAREAAQNLLTNAERVLPSGPASERRRCS
jgi:AcrR family transcriptional regulator